MMWLDTNLYHLGIYIQLLCLLTLTPTVRGQEIIAIPDGTCSIDDGECDEVPMTHILTDENSEKVTLEQGSHENNYNPSEHDIAFEQSVEEQNQEEILADEAINESSQESDETDFEAHEETAKPAATITDFGYDDELPDEPLQLIKPDPLHKRLVIIEKNLKYLEKIKGIVATVAVVGKYHSGKSFLLNQLMGKSEGFGLGTSLRPMTMGIWIWGKPINFTLTSGENISVVFLDTEGFASYNVSENYDAKIFAVAALLSSYLIYNSVKIIDQADIEYLELLARRTQLFALRSQMAKPAWTDFNLDLLSFPPLLWVVQDFVQFTEEGVSTQEWLHEMMSSRFREDEEYEINLLGIFKYVDCHTLFFPATDKELVADLSLAKEEDLTPEYRQQRNELMEKLRRDLVPKEKNREPISGSGLVTLLQLLVNAANDGSLAEIPNRWQVFIKRMKDSAIADCFEYYSSEMESLKRKFSNEPINPGMLTEKHMENWKQSIRLLHQLLFGLGEIIEDATEKLSEQIYSEHSRIKERNDKRIRVQCSETLKKVEEDTAQKLDMLKLPMTSRDLYSASEAISKKALEIFGINIEAFVNNEEMETYAQELKNSLAAQNDSVTLKNNRAIEKLLDDAVKQSIGDESQDKTLLSLEDLESALSAKKEEAGTQFEQFTGLIKEESLYPAYHALFQNKMQENVENMRLRNQKLANEEIKRLIKDLMEKFEEATTQSDLPMPARMVEFDLFLQKELDNVERQFNNFVRLYVDNEKNVADTRKELMDQLMEIFNKRKKGNMQAFIREVEVPLTMAKRVIMLSAHDFQTAFNLRSYMKKVCMRYLDDSKSKMWSKVSKETVIDHFIETDEELSEMLNSRKGFLSTLLGWISWFFDTDL